MGLKLLEGLWCRRAIARQLYALYVVLYVHITLVYAVLFDMVAEQGSLQGFNPLNALRVETLNGENLPSFALKLGGLMIYINSEFEVLFKHFEGYTKDITDEDFKDPQGTRQEDNVQLSKLFKTMLFNHCDYQFDVVLQA